MVSDLARKLRWTRAIVLDLRHARDCRDDVVDGYRLESEALEELARVGAKQIQMTRAASMRRLPRRRDQHGGYPASAPRFIHVQRADQRRVDLRLDTNHSDCFIADVSDDVTSGRPLDSFRHHAGTSEHFAHEREVARLLDYQFACAMLSYRHAAISDLLFRRREELHAGLVNNRDCFDRTRTRSRDNYRVVRARRVDDFGLALVVELKHGRRRFHAVAAADAAGFVYRDRKLRHRYLRGSA